MDLVGHHISAIWPQINTDGRGSEPTLTRKRLSFRQKTGLEVGSESGRGDWGAGANRRASVVFATTPADPKSIRNVSSPRRASHAGTAAFNLNLLARTNRELEAGFVLNQFEHVARFNSETQSVEMHLRSLQKQSVAIRKADLTVTFEEGETIWTENSHKYSLEEAGRMADTAGFDCAAQWIDYEWPFAESLLMVA
jgi:histidine-specific SAM-dependent methyltransferase